MTLVAQLTSPASGDILSGTVTLAATVSEVFTARVYAAYVEATPVATATPPGAVTSPATGIASRSATLNGSYSPSPDLQPTTVWFDWGSTVSYGHSTPKVGITDSAAIAQARVVPITGLRPNRVYHFRLAARNSVGTAYGADRTFRTTGTTGVALEGTVTDGLVDAITPWRTDDLESYAEAIGSMFEGVESYTASDGDERSGWSALFDPEIAPDEALGYIAMLVGETLPVGGDPDEARDRIAAQPHRSRGTVASITAAAQRYLQGERDVTIIERDGAVDQLTVITYATQTPDPVAVQAAVQAVCPADVILSYVVTTTKVWGNVRTDFPTWSSVLGVGKTWRDIWTDSAPVVTTGTKPAAPTGLATDGASTDGKLHAQWTANASPDPDNYQLYVNGQFVLDNLHKSGDGKVHVVFPEPNGTYTIAVTCGPVSINGQQVYSDLSTTITITVTGAPTFSAPPVVTGSLAVGATLTTTNGTVVGTPTIAYAYAWQTSSDGGQTWTNIAGANATTYVVQAADAGKQIRSVVAASNSVGGPAYGPSNVVSIPSSSTTPAIPTGLSADGASTDGKIHVKWDANAAPDPDQYQLYVNDAWVLDNLHKSAVDGKVHATYAVTSDGTYSVRSSCGPVTISGQQVYGAWQATPLNVVVSGVPAPTGTVLHSYQTPADGHTPSDANPSPWQQTQYWSNNNANITDPTKLRPGRLRVLRLVSTSASVDGDNTRDHLHGFPAEFPMGVERYYAFSRMTDACPPAIYNPHWFSLTEIFGNPFTGQANMHMELPAGNQWHLRFTAGGGPIVEYYVPWNAGEWRDWCVRWLPSTTNGICQAWTKLASSSTWNLITFTNGQTIFNGQNIQTPDPNVTWERHALGHVYGSLDVIGYAAYLSDDRVATTFAAATAGM